MPLYTVSSQAGTLCAADKAALAAKITETHCQVSGVPESWVHVVFHDYPADSGFTAGRLAATVALTSVIRTISGI